jgi:hypothetical protein
MLGSNDKMPLAATARRSRHFRFPEAKMTRPNVGGSIYRRSGLLRNTQLRTTPSSKNTLNISRLTEILMPPQIWPHLTVLILVSLLRYAAPVIHTNPSWQCRNAIREPDFLLPK